MEVPASIWGFSIGGESLSGLVNREIPYSAAVERDVLRGIWKTRLAEADGRRDEDCRRRAEAIVRFLDGCGPEVRMFTWAKYEVAVIFDPVSEEALRM